MENFLYFRYLKIITDSGYESEENYVYTKENGQLSYITPANYEIAKTRKYKDDISRIENMDYDEFGDYYTCKNNKKLPVNRIIKRRCRNLLGGYVSENVGMYPCEDCTPPRNCN
ncbi:hypothetical protein [Clostridium pasteurianum]|uniref:hypothetical protein n=1 Tax=Clostridium pasteurianum TaxID=1501 RepID=UPI003119FED6